MSMSTSFFDFSSALLDFSETTLINAMPLMEKIVIFGCDIWMRVC